VKKPRLRLKKSKDLLLRRTRCWRRWRCDQKPSLLPKLRLEKLNFLRGDTIDSADAATNVAGMAMHDASNSKLRRDNMTLIQTSTDIRA
jgi:hypothetical protein